MDSTTTTLQAPTDVRARFAKLDAWRQQAADDLAEIQGELLTVRSYLTLSDRVTVALETLSHQLFRELLDLIEEELSIALMEVLNQPIQLKAEVQWRRNAASVDFWVERNGNREDILKGQGGSVTNVLSVGLRMFALTTLDEKSHRRFLVLDEQDCWLRPDLVPSLVKIVHEAGKALGFQVLMISHHDVSAFSQYADRIYQFTPQGETKLVLRAWKHLPQKSTLNKTS
jgi:ABC-type glutathione transport system ATPase component